MARPQAAGYPLTGEAPVVRRAGADFAGDPDSQVVADQGVESLGGYAMDRSVRLRIGHFLEGRAGPYLG